MIQLPTLHWFSLLEVNENSSDVTILNPHPYSEPTTISGDNFLANFDVVHKGEF